MPKRSINQPKRVSKKPPPVVDPNPKPMRDWQFSRFRQLPTQTRLQIWRAALLQATVDRTIHVEVHPQFQATAHACFTSTGDFCGQHGSCPRFIEGVPHWSTYCMSDGYFASTDLVSGPEESESSLAMASLSLACRESRTVVIEMYPQVLRVYQGPWHSAAKSRLVRCSPETDMLVIYAVPDMSLNHTYFPSLTSEEYWRHTNESMMKKFPYSDKQFAAFRELVSCFQNVAIFSRLLGGGEMFPVVSQGSEDSQDWEDGRERYTNKVPGIDLFNSGDMTVLLLYFTSLKHLYFWLDPVCYANAWDDPIRVSNARDLKPDEEPDVKHLQNNVYEFIGMYNEYVQIEKDHRPVADETHWVSQPKPLERVGCLCPASWLR
ncbi:hypothetical protein TGAMA5MH_04536 [Trichoderma gamsii]|uniref:2EXR domain-containing protein n=1 Tax=Trichoderma gamsii TaxID=398673 RepID=A0A2K0TDG4_9HYPO|nr:hypothetical protein TGAMA5MH_04536 [Trichoderma gamsii]